MGQGSNGSSSIVGPVLVLVPGTLSGSDALGTLSGLNDLADTGATLIKAAGKNATGIPGTVSTLAPLVAAPISGLTLDEGVQSGDQQKMFDGGYGVVTLIVSTFAPEVAAGMALGKVLGDFATPNDNDPNILERAALAPPAQKCTP